MILLLLLTLSIKLALESKYISSSALLAITILTKPYFLICLLPYLLIKKYKSIVYVFVWLLAFVIVSGAAIGFEKSFSLYSEWILAMKEHSTYLSSNHTFFALLSFYIGVKIPSSFGIIILGIIGILSFAYLWLKNGKNQIEVSKNFEQVFLLYYFILIALIPSILITDTEHFLFSLPLIVLLFLKVKQENKFAYTIFFIVLMFLYGGNSSDLLGKSLAGKVEDWGLLGIGNLIIIFVAIYLLGRQNKGAQRNII